MMARLIADAPKLKAAVDTNDPPTVQDIANGYQQQLNSNLLLVTNKPGRGARDRRRVAAAPRHRRRPAGGPRGARRPRELSLLPQPDGMLQLVTVPIAVGLTQPGDARHAQRRLPARRCARGAAQGDHRQRHRVRHGRQILAATLPREDYAALADRLRTTGISRRARSAREEYVALPRPLRSTAERRRPAAAPVALILRSRTEQLRLLQAIHTGLAATAVVAVLLATLLSFAVARTITRPLAAITDVMREVAATGDLTRKIAAARGQPVGRRGRAAAGDDVQHADRFDRALPARDVAEGAAVVARPAVDRDRARGPQSADDHQGGAAHAAPARRRARQALREAVADIDEEVARLNRIVNEVLDFARPIGSSSRRPI